MDVPSFYNIQYITIKERPSKYEINRPLLYVDLYLVEATANTISVNVGINTSGGLVAPLQMEFVASILENSNA